MAFVIGTMRGGGAQRVVSVLGKYFVGQGNDVDIITTSDSILDYKLDKRIRFIPLQANSNIPILKQFRCFYKLASEIKIQQYEYVVAFLPMTCIYVCACKLTGLKFSFIASERMDPYQDPNSKILRIIRDFAYSKADGVVFQTEDAKKYYSNKRIKRSKIIYNPINENIPLPQYENRKELIVTSVRLEKQKNIDMLIEAFELFHQKYQEYILEIYGQGNLMNELQKKIEKKSLGEYVYLKGFTQNIYEAMKNAKFFVLSSDYEGVSNSMLEALCLGLPVVSTDHPIGGARMFIKDSFNGYLSPVKDYKLFYENMCRVANLSDEEYFNMCENAALLRNELKPTQIYSEWSNFIFDEV